MSKIPSTVAALLDSEFGLPGLTPGNTYGRIHPLEGDGGLTELCVIILENRDVCVYIAGSDGESSLVLRFCSYEGGGTALRTRNALLLLAEAIRLDNLEHPYR